METFDQIKTIYCDCPRLIPSFVMILKDLKESNLISIKNTLDGISVFDKDDYDYVDLYGDFILEAKKAHLV